MNNSEYKEYGWNDDMPLSYHDNLLNNIIKLLPTDNLPILDIGCGNGYIANELIERGYNVYGIDASERGIEIANRKNSGRFFVTDVASSQLPKPIRDIPFKVIISTEVIEHLYSPRMYVRFMKEILAKNGGGYLLISTPYHGYAKNIAVAITDRSDYHFCPLWEGGHIKFWSRNTLTSLLHDEGFHSFKFQGVGHFPFFWKIMLLKAEV